MEKEKNNMEIWNAVCKTDPKHTKEVKFGRRFTAIGAYYQIMQATKLFGPMGTGWWYTIDNMEQTDTMLICSLSLHYKGQAAPIPVMSATSRFMKDKEDEDAYKKVITDCLTKALSYLGFSADVFTGEFDGTDNKYAAQQQQASPGASKNKSQSSGPNTGPGATEKQRKAIWGISMNICGGDRDAAKKLVDDVCNNEGLDSGNLSMAHASVVIEKLHERNS